MAGSTTRKSLSGADTHATFSFLTHKDEQPDELLPAHADAATMLDAETGEPLQVRATLCARFAPPGIQGVARVRARVGLCSCGGR